MIVESPWACGSGQCGILRANNSALMRWGFRESFPLVDIIPRGNGYINLGTLWFDLIGIS